MKVMMLKNGGLIKNVELQELDCWAQGFVSVDPGVFIFPLEVIKLYL